MDVRQVSGLGSTEVGLLCGGGRVLTSQKTRLNINRACTCMERVAKVKDLCCFVHGDDSPTTVLLTARAFKRWGPSGR